MKVVGAAAVFLLPGTIQLKVNLGNRGPCLMSNRFSLAARSMSHWAWLLVVPQLAVCSGGSTGVTTEPPVRVVTTIDVAPPNASLEVGATQALVATVKDQSGNIMADQSITWSSDNSQAASVSSGGLVTAVAAGAAKITASSGRKTGASDITVLAPPATPVVTSVTVSPASTSVAKGATVTLVATVKDPAGSVLTGQTITWSTSDASVATVSSSGVVTGVTAGLATITGTSSGKSGTSSITVTAVSPVVTTVTVSPPSASIDVGATASLTATVRDAQGNVMNGQTVTWTTSNGSYAAV